MAMVINTNTQATQTYGVYSKNNSYMNEAMTRIATGRKINSAKDNASTWAITQRMRDRIRANDQANQNVQNDSALIKTAQGGISNTIDILTTLRERAINSANDSNLNLDRKAISAEVGQLVDQIQDNATKVKFNGRYLLNGAADDSAVAAAKTSASSTIVEPDPVALAAKTEKGTHAVYELNLTNMRTYDSTTVKYKALGESSAAAGAGAKLTDLYEAGLQTSTALTPDQQAGQQFRAANSFKEGDKITFSWLEDGEEQSYTYEVTKDSTIADLAFEKGHLKFSAFDNSSGSTAMAVTSQESSAKYDSDRNGKITADDKAQNAVYDKTGAAVSVSANGYKMYAVGDKDVAITDFKVAVTYNDVLNGGVETTRTEAQKALSFTNTQRAAGEPTGTASTYMLADGKAITQSTAVSGLFTAASVDATDVLTFKFGDASVDVSGASTVEDLQRAFKDQGVAVNIVQSTATKVKDGDGAIIKKDGEDGDFTATASSNQALVFAGKTGQTIDFSDISITAKDKDGVTKTSSIDEAERTFTNLLTIKDEEKSAASEKLEIAPSNPLTFHVGGEAEFAIDVTIEKMTVDNLFAERDADGNITKIHDTKSFSELFDTKDGAKHALGILDDALNRALAEQTKLGALENRLGYTSDNITTMNENLETAISTYRDSDIAKEMTDYMKYSVLNQASQYMLAQASQNAYSIVQLLQA